MIKKRQGVSTKMEWESHAARSRFGVVRIRQNTTLGNKQDIAPTPSVVNLASQLQLNAISLLEDLSLLEAYHLPIFANRGSAQGSLLYGNGSASRGRGTRNRLAELAI